MSIVAGMADGVEAAYLMGPEQNTSGGGEFDVGKGLQALLD